MKKRFLDRVHDAWVNLIRFIGKQVCRIKYHNFFSADGSYDNYSAYTCVRCHELSRDIETLPPIPDDDVYSDRMHGISREEVEESWEREGRWISWLPYPRWV